MHELGIARDFWAVIKETAGLNKLKKITKIVMVRFGLYSLGN